MPESERGRVAEELWVMPSILPSRHCLHRPGADPDGPAALPDCDQRGIDGGGRILEDPDRLIGPRPLKAAQRRQVRRRGDQFVNAVGGLSGVPLIDGQDEHLCGP